MTVLPVNQAPTLDPITTSRHDRREQRHAAPIVNLTGISDGDGGTQIVHRSSPPAATRRLILPAVTLQRTPSATGTVNITPLPNQSGTAMITVTVMDNGGTANGGVNSVSQTLHGDGHCRSTRPPR